MTDSLKRRRILNEGTNMEILWLFLKEDLELRSNIEHYLDKGSNKINAIKCLKRHTENITASSDPPIWPNDKFPSLREYKDTIDKYHKRYTITKKIKKLRKRIEKWARKNGYENIGKQKEVKDKLTGDYFYMYTDWEMVDDHHGLMINDWDWLPSKKQYKEYNVLWKNYSNVQNLV